MIPKALVTVAVVLGILSALWLIDGWSEPEIWDSQAGASTHASNPSDHSQREGNRSTGAVAEAESDSAEAKVVEDPLFAEDDWPPVFEGPEDLEKFVEWMRGLSEAELLRLTNAEFNFNGSPLIDLLHSLEGEWVVSTLGRLAVGEDQTLLKSVLVEGLCGGVSFERYDDEEFLPILSTLLIEFSNDELDPYGVGIDIVDSSFSSCLRRGVDYPGFAEPFLVKSDNTALLISGYSFMGGFAGSEAVMADALATHPNAGARLGAMTGIGFSVTAGLMQPEDATRLGLLALETEADEQCKDYIFAMLAKDGGESGRQVLEEMIAALDVENMGRAAKLLATSGDPESTLMLIEQALAREDLDDVARTDMYIALGALPGSDGAQKLIDIVADGERSAEDRAAGLKGLWNSELNGEMALTLQDVVLAEGDPAVRVEALRLLNSGAGPLGDLDVRDLASLDADPSVRSEAIVQASMEPSADTRDWLEERMASDSSVEVKAAALGALVMHAHYAGGGDAVSTYLNRAGSLSKDPEVQRMIQRGRDLVSSHDSRSVELGLAEDARIFSKIASVTDGVTSRSFERQSQQLYKVIAALRAASQ